MVQATVGQRVQVDISGLQAPGVSFGGGVSSTGTIVAINAAARQITVQLDISVNGNNTVVVGPERVSLG